jgi:hypothetical protein
LTNKPLPPELGGILSGKEIAVPRFYFDVREGAELTPDNEGLEFGSLEAAEYEAARAAAEIGRDDLPKGKARDVTVEVRDEHGRQVLTVTVAMTVRRTKPAHT